MPTQLKVDRVAQIAEKLDQNAGLFVVNYSGLSVKQAEELRRNLRESNAELKIFKNNLVKIALADKGVEGLDDILVGPTACVFYAEDPVAPAKALKEFVADNPVLEVKGGYSDGTVVSAADVQAIADLPSREELIAKLLGTMQNPMAKTVRVLNGPMQAFVTALTAIQDQKAA